VKTLFLDLASHSQQPGQGACIACVSDNTTEAIRFVDHRMSDDGLIPLVNDIFKEAACTAKDVTNLACIVGPGGFTSLRMAVTLTNTYADLLHIPVVGVHQSDVYRARTSEENFVWIHATKKQELFVRGFGSYASLWPEAVLLTLTDLVEAFPEGAGVAGELLPEQRLLLEQKGLKDIELLPLAEALPSFLGAQTYTETVLQPWYGRGW